jgi:hypothetical protein
MLMLKAKKLTVIVCGGRARKGNRKYTYDKTKILPGIVYWLGFGVKCNR